MIVFKKIRFKNFLSTGNSFNEIIFDEHERTLVTASNGSGKSSSCIDSITFALYGKSHRNIRKDQLINSTNEKDLLVELWFNIGSTEYKIERGLKPNIFEIYIDSIKQNSLSNIKDMQAFLENDILKMNYVAFVNVAILSSSDYIPFMQQTLATRRLLVEELLDINIFGDMLVIIKERIKLVNAEIKDFDYQIASLNKQIEIQKKLISNIENTNNLSTIDNKIKIDELINSNNKLSSDIEKINNVYDKLILDLDNYVNSYELNNKFLMYINTYKNKIKEHQKTLKFYNDNNSCPTCTQELNAVDKQQHIITCNKKISELTLGIETVLKKQEVCLIEISKHKKIQSDINNLDKIKSNKQYQLNTNNTQIVKYQNPVIIDTNQLTTETENLILQQNRIAQYLIDLVNAKKDLENYQVISHMLSDNGIKSKIIDKYIPLFNKYINNYLEQFGVYINFIFDNTFKESIKSRYRDMFSYSSFSEGEKIKISLSIMLAFRDLARLKNSVNTNLLIMDEIFDSSLDFESNKNLMGILKTMSDTNIIIISHRNDLKEDDFDRVLHFRKEHNFSVIDTAIT